MTKLWWETLIGQFQDPDAPTNGGVSSVLGDCALKG